MNSRKITLILNAVLLYVIGYICYKFYYDVLYKIQFQIPFLSKTYYCIDSHEFSFILVTVYLVCLLLMRWWFSLIVLLPLLPLPIFVLQWMKYRYNYTQGFINGMIWHKELFNYNMNFYLFKGLEDWQKSWVVWKEIGHRINSVSFLVYGECRDFFKDPYIMHFFDDFRLDLNDSESFERIRGQLDIYQRAKIKLSRVIIERDFYYYKAEHPIKYYFNQCLDYVLEYPERIFLYSVLTIVLVNVLWYNIIEEPLIYRLIGKPVYESSSDSDSDGGSEGLFDFMIQALGRVNPGTSPDVVYYNLRQVVRDNIELMAPLNNTLMHDINPELNRAVIEKLIPKVYNSQLVCEKIIDYLDNMNSPYESCLDLFPYYILILIFLLILISAKKLKKKKKNEFPI